MSVFLGKSVESIHTKMYKLGITLSKRWTEEEINFLLENYSYMDNSEIIKYINRKRYCIIDKAIELGLTKKIFKKKYNPKDFLDNVKNFAEQLGRTPLVTEIFKQEWAIPNASLNRYFGGYRNVCKLLDLDININVFGSVKPIYKSINNDLCWSKSEMIITNFFINNDIKYKKEVFYKDYCDDARFNNKSADWLIGENIFVEYFGMMDKDYYYLKAQNKIKLCKENNLKLISLIGNDISKLKIIFEDFIIN